MLYQFFKKMSAEQVINIAALECPICMDTIEFNKNCVMTECGHAFHCSCLMQNAAHNGFGCPYCRTKMAEEVEEENEDEDEDENDIENETVFEEDVLTSFRMFHQRINGEEVEEEPEEDWESVASDEDQEDEDEEQDVMPDAAYTAQKLIERGITMEDLVKNILFQEHSNFEEHYTEYSRRSSEVYGQFRAIISQYTPQAPEQTVTPTVAELPSVALPAVAESKTTTVNRRREFMLHV